MAASLFCRRHPSLPESCKVGMKRATIRVAPYCIWISTTAVSLGSFPLVCVRLRYTPHGLSRLTGGEVDAYAGEHR